MATRKKVEQSLRDQLEHMGANVAHFADMIDDYMKFWDVKEMLQADIIKRGVAYQDSSSVGVKMMKNNPSVSELVKVNTRMLAILKEMGLTTENVPNDDMIL